MSTESPDWVRLHKALAVEAERGFTDLGKQYRFSEFLSLRQTPVTLPAERRRWQEMAAQFASYPQLTIEERQHLVGSNPLVSTPAARWGWGEGRWGETSIKIKTKIKKTPRTTPLVSPTQLM